MAEARGWSRVYSSFDPLHFGYFGGMTTKIIWFILGLAPGVLALTALLVWQASRNAAHRLRFAAATGLCAAW